ncbi:MarR family winged helix-turn-helix transcriptional regulator [Streptacidiphilus sp. P02-A3a]|uniref:MarR family winged helix-turn-helix transcriptional regulator n=1 Tax=Streptacidiphilus sp. P02-A3a TaxID=2704468 RepID=UPI0015FA5D5D|nr:MarR family transcriptional regulator [Streptacidiphilus sp. P02-A3a]QMU69798.1 MarR family transcriptional regulator [Streptacidiphilus sp. P02-A3a]
MPEPHPSTAPGPGRDQALDRLARAAYSLSAADSRLRGRATRTPGTLSLTHARALRALAETGPLSIGQLAAATETTGAATTQLVNGLAAAGYVTRERPADDKRSVLVALTDTGRRHHRERQAALAEALDTTLTQYDTTALDAATDVLRQLAAIYDRL